MQLVVRTIRWLNNYFLLRGYWTSAALWHLEAICYERCEGHGMTNGLPKPIMELKEAMNIPIWAGIADGGKLFI